MNDTPVFESNGNVFADLGFENSAEEQVKATLVRGIRTIIKRRRLTQSKAGELMGLQQPDVSAIVNGRTSRFSVDRLLGCLDKLDYKVDVVIRHKDHHLKLETTATV